MKVGSAGGSSLIGSLCPSARSHEVVWIPWLNHMAEENISQPDSSLVPTSIPDRGVHTCAFAGCSTVAFCAGIDRAAREQAYARLRKQGTASMVEAAAAGPFLPDRARTRLRANGKEPTA